MVQYLPGPSARRRVVAAGVNIFFAVVIIVVLGRFTADPVIVSDMVYFDGAPKGEGGMPREEGTL